jgi:hypothetical protein
VSNATIAAQHAPKQATAQPIFDFEKKSHIAPTTKRSAAPLLRTTPRFAQLAPRMLFFLFFVVKQTPFCHIAKHISFATSKRWFFRLFPLFRYIKIRKKDALCYNPITKRIIGRRHGACRVPAKSQILWDAAQAQGCTKRTAQAEHRIDEPRIFL